jgi:SAM-dependent methyltransferase
MKLYDELAEWWPLFSSPDEYLLEAGVYARLLRAAALEPLRTVLELGSGGGNNARHLKASFAMTLVEPSEGMRAVSQALNPECEHHPGDMRTVRLGRTFDAVFVHDAVSYMRTEDDLRRMAETVAVHLAPGGVALILPDGTVEAFGTEAVTGGHDEPGGRGVRFLEWSLPLAPGATSTGVHYAILLREADGSVRSVHDVHEIGVFPRATWLRVLGDAGLDARLEPTVLDEDEPPCDLFLATRR